MAGYFDMLTKLRRYPQAGPCVFIDPSGYEEFVADAQETFRKVLKFVSGQLTKPLDAPVITITCFMVFLLLIVLVLLRGLHRNALRRTRCWRAEPESSTIRPLRFVEMNLSNSSTSLLPIGESGTYRTADRYLSEESTPRRDSTVGEKSMAHSEIQNFWSGHVPNRLICSFS